MIRKTPDPECRWCAGSGERRDWSPAGLGTSFRRCGCRRWRSWSRRDWWAALLGGIVPMVAVWTLVLMLDRALIDVEGARRTAIGAKQGEIAALERELVAVQGEAEIAKAFAHCRVVAGLPVYDPRIGAAR